MAILSIKGDKRHFAFGKVDSKTVAYFNKHDIDLNRYNNFLSNNEDDDEPALKIDDKFNFAKGHNSLFEINDIIDFYAITLSKDSYLEIIDDNKSSIFLTRMDCPTMLSLGAKIVLSTHYGSLVLDNSSKKETVLYSNNGDTHTDNYKFSLDDNFDITKITLCCYMYSGDFYVQKITYDNQEIIIDSQMNKDLEERWAGFEFTNPDWI